MKSFATIASAVIFAALACATPLACAADKIADVTDLQAMRKSVETDKKGYVASLLNLTGIEGKKFWPVYDTYQRDLDLINRRRNLALEGLINRDKPLSEPYARALANELIAADEAEVKARRKMQNQVMRILPARKAARYLQLESKIRAVQAYAIAEGFPLLP